MRQSIACLRAAARPPAPPTPASPAHPPPHSLSPYICPAPSLQRLARCAVCVIVRESRRRDARTSRSRRRVASRFKLFAKLVVAPKIFHNLLADGAVAARRRPAYTSVEIVIPRLVCIAIGHLTQVIKDFQLLTPRIAYLCSIVKRPALPSLCLHEDCLSILFLHLCPLDHLVGIDVLCMVLVMVDLKRTLADLGFSAL